MEWRTHDTLYCHWLPASENPTYNPDHQGRLSLTNIDNASITDNPEDLEAADPAFPGVSLQGRSQWMVAEPTPYLQLRPFAERGLEQSLLWKICPDALQVFRASGWPRPLRKATYYVFTASQYFTDNRALPGHSDH